MKMLSSTMRNTSLKLQQTQEHPHHRNRFLHLAVGKGGCYHPASQGDNYTHYHQPLKMTRLLGHKKDKLVLQFQYKESSPWTFPSDWRLDRLSSAPYFMRNKIPESRFSPVPHLSIHSFTRAPYRWWPASHSCLQTRFFSAGTSRLPAATFSALVSIWKI